VPLCQGSALTLEAGLGHVPLECCRGHGPASTPSRMLRYSAEEIVAILQGAYSDEPDPGLEEVLTAFRSQWMAIAARRYAGLGALAEDAAQTALLKLVDPRGLATLDEPRKIEAWGRRIFVNEILDLCGTVRLARTRYVTLAEGGEGTEFPMLDQLSSMRPLGKHTGLAGIRRLPAGTIRETRSRVARRLPQDNEQRYNASGWGDFGLDGGRFRCCRH
jgi:hypothetical protein